MKTTRGKREEGVREIAARAHGRAPLDTLINGV